MIDLGEDETRESREDLGEKSACYLLITYYLLLITYYLNQGWGRQGRMGGIGGMGR